MFLKLTQRSVVTIFDVGRHIQGNANIARKTSGSEIDDDRIDRRTLRVAIGWLIKTAPPSGKRVRRGSECRHADSE